MNRNNLKGPKKSMGVPFRWQETIQIHSNHDLLPVHLEISDISTEWKRETYVICGVDSLYPSLVLPSCYHSVQMTLYAPFPFDTWNLTKPFMDQKAANQVLLDLLSKMGLGAGQGRTKTPPSRIIDQNEHRTIVTSAEVEHDASAHQSTLPFYIAGGDQLWFGLLTIQQPEEIQLDLILTQAVAERILSSIQSVVEESTLEILAAEGPNEGTSEEDIQEPVTHSMPSVPSAEDSQSFTEEKSPAEPADTESDVVILQDTREEMEHPAEGESHSSLINEDHEELQASEQILDSEETEYRNHEMDIPSSPVVDEMDVADPLEKPRDIDPAISLDLDLPGTVEQDSDFTISPNNENDCYEANVTGSAANQPQETEPQDLTSCLFDRGLIVEDHAEPSCEGTTEPAVEMLGEERAEPAAEPVCEGTTGLAVEMSGEEHVEPACEESAELPAETIGEEMVEPADETPGEEGAEPATEPACEETAELPAETIGEEMVEPADETPGEEGAEPAAEPVCEENAELPAETIDEETVESAVEAATDEYEEYMEDDDQLSSEIIDNSGNEAIQEQNGPIELDVPILRKEDEPAITTQCSDWNGNTDNTARSDSFDPIGNKSREVQEVPPIAEPHAQQEPETIMKTEPLFVQDEIELLIQYRWILQQLKSDLVPHESPLLMDRLGALGDVQDARKLHQICLASRESYQAKQFIEETIANLECQKAEIHEKQVSAREQIRQIEQKSGEKERSFQTISSYAECQKQQELFGITQKLEQKQQEIRGLQEQLIKNQQALQSTFFLSFSRKKQFKAQIEQLKAALETSNTELNALGRLRDEVLSRTNDDLLQMELEIQQLKEQQAVVQGDLIHLAQGIQANDQEAEDKTKQLHQLSNHIISLHEELTHLIAQEEIALERKLDPSFHPSNGVEDVLLHQAIHRDGCGVPSIVCLNEGNSDDQ